MILQKRQLLFIVSMVIAFVAGAASYGIFVKPAPETQAAGRKTAAPETSPAETASSVPQPPLSRRDSRPDPVVAPTQGSLVLRAEVVDAILAGGGERKLFQRMGLTEQDREQVTKIKNERLASFKQLEAGYASVVSDPQGGHVEIDPFPDERGDWLKAMEEDLRKQLGDDRASVIARIIAFSDNDEDVGMFRRQLFVTPPQEAGGKFRVEEKTYNEQGQHMDSDYELIDDRSKSRWGHLLDFENGN